MSCDFFDEDALSGGWVFIIVLLCAIILYCGVGYVVMALTVNKDNGFADFANNIPQRAFWAALPSLVMAGCIVTKEVVMERMNKGQSGGGTSGKPLVDDDL